MVSKWRKYWDTQCENIEQGLSEWRQSGSARLELQNLESVSSRKDLYSGGVTVTPTGRQRGGGQRHTAELATMVAPLLRKGECVRLRIEGKESSADHLVITSG